MIILILQPTLPTEILYECRYWCWLIMMANMILVKVMTLLETTMLCVLVFACLLYHIEKKVSKSINCYGIIHNTNSSLCSCISSILPSSCRPYYNYWSHLRRRSQRNNSNNSCCYGPLDRRRNKSGIANQRGKYRYFQNRNGSKAEHAKARLHPGISTDELTSDPSSSPSVRSLFSKVLPQFLLPQVRFTKLIKLYYRGHSKYQSWKQRLCWRPQRYFCELNDWDHVEDWTPTDIVNIITLPYHDKYYNINYLFIRTLLFLVMWPLL